MAATRPFRGADTSAAGQGPSGEEGSRARGSSPSHAPQPRAWPLPAAALMLGAWGLLALLSLRAAPPPGPSAGVGALSVAGIEYRNGRAEDPAPQKGRDPAPGIPRPAALRRGQHGPWQGLFSASNRSTAPDFSPSRVQAGGAPLEARGAAAETRSGGWSLWPCRALTRLAWLPSIGRIRDLLFGPWTDEQQAGRRGEIYSLARSLHCQACPAIAAKRPLPREGPGPWQPRWPWGDWRSWAAWEQRGRAAFTQWGAGGGGRGRRMQEKRSNDWLVTAWLKRGAPGVRKAASQGLGQYLSSFFRRREADAAQDRASEGGAASQEQGRKSTDEKKRRRRSRSKGAEYSWHWPQQLVGRDWKSPFVADTRILPMEEVPSCMQGRLPPDLHPSPLVRGRNVTTDDLERLKEQHRFGRVPQREDEEDPPLRVLVWYPRFGLGNSLRGFTSSLVYAFLSGRQMLRWHGGSHAEVLDTLCMGFKCGLDVLEFGGDIRHVSHGMGVRTHQLIKSLHVASPVVHISSGSFFDFWLKEPDMLQCVLDAFQCQDRWCVRTRALQMLLGNGPTEELSAALEDVLDVASPVPLPAAATPSAAVGPLPAASTTAPPVDLRRPPPNPPPHSSALSAPQKLPAQQAGAVSRSTKEESKKKSAKGRRKQEGKKRRGHRRRLLRHMLLSSFPKQSRAPKHSLGTSSSSTGAQRPLSRRSLAADSKKDAGDEDEEGEATMGPMDKGAGMRLQFDVAIHIRTHSKYLENVRCITGKGDCQKAAEAKARMEAARASGHLASRSWICLSSVLAFAHRSKFQQQTSSEGESRVSSPENLKMLLAHSSLDPGALANDAGPRGETGSEDGAEPSGGPDLDAITAKWRAKVEREAPWTVENAVAFASEALAGTLPEQRMPSLKGNSTRRRLLSGSAKNSEEDEDEEEIEDEPDEPNTGSPSRGSRLAILLATDSESMRPQLVEFLRPFGVVFYSSGKVSHLSKSRGATEKKLPTLVEFYLLSKAALLVSHVRYISTFALFAAMYGNGTLASGGALNSCRYHVEHLMEPPKMP